MVAADLIEQVMSIEEHGEQRRLLAVHGSSLDGEQVIQLLKKQADQYLRADIGRTLELVDLMHYFAELTGDPMHRAVSLLAEANAHSIGLGEYQKGIELYDEAAAIYHGLDRPVDQARSQVGKIWALTSLGRYAEAIKVGQWASTILESHGELKILVGIIHNLGIAQCLAGDDLGSLEMLDQADVLYHGLEQEGTPDWLWVQQNRAVVLRNLGRFEDSIQASQVAEEGLRHLGQKVAAARARQNLAVTHFVLGRYNEALEHLDQVRDVFLADGRRRDAMLVELYISDCLLQLRRFNDVLEKCGRVRSLFADIGTHHVVAQAIINEGVAFAELGHYAEALDSLAEAREIFEQEGNRVWVASTDLEMAAVLLRQGRYDESLSLAQACAAVFRAHSLPIEDAQARLVAARAAVALEQHDRALRLATQVLKVGQERNVPTLKYQGQHVLGDLAIARGARQEALAAYDRSIQEVERLRGRLMVEFRAGFLEDKEEIYEDAVGLCLELNQPLLGLEYAERAKSRALLDLLAQRLDLGIQARSPADRPLVEELMRLRAERDRLYRRWESDAESGERGWTSSEGDRGQAQQEVLALEKQITDLWHRLLIRNADYAREAALWTVRTEAPQPYLDPDTLLVEYFFVHGKLVVFLVSAEGVEARRVPGDRTQIQALSRLLWLNLKTVPKSSPKQVITLAGNARGLLQRLCGLLIAPVNDRVAGYEKLVIVPHGPLHYLPFHALHDGTAYLLQRHEISYLPGASFLRYCQQVQAAEGSLFAVGHSHGGRLPHAVQEAQAVTALLDGRALLEDEATVAQLRQTMPECRVVHLAAHGDFRADNPVFSGISLADGWLTTLDIFNLRLKASLVTLSACQTGRNVVAGGDELLGLMRASLCAGAASLVLSLWAVEDRSTAQLMERFYEKLAQGWTKGASLRQAQLQFVQGQQGLEPAAYGHPYFWAPFFLVGNTGPL